jgi:hypothetical protein
MSHLLFVVEDYAMGMGECCLTHLEAVLKLSDPSRDPEVTDISMFRERAEGDAEFRSVHRHVCDTRLAVNTVRACREALLKSPFQSNRQAT